MLVSFNNWNIVLLANKTTLSDDFDEIQKVFLGGISYNMVSLVHTGKYGSIHA